MDERQGGRVRAPRRSRQAGFSYIEVLVGIMILAIVAGGIVQGLAATSASLGKSRAETTATKLASAALDRAHRMAYEDVGLVGGSPPGLIPASTTQTVNDVQYTIATDVEYVDDPALGQPQTYVNYKRVTVTVTPATNRSRPMQETTLVAPPAIGAIAGKSTIVATVIDALTDQPVAGAPVTVDLSTSPTQTRNTGSDGKVVFAGLEPSALAATDPKYKYRLTVGLPDPWVTHPDSAPSQAQQHLAASQTWTTTLKVFKRATVNVNVRDAATGQLITERTQVQVTTPSPDPLSDTLIGATGLFTFNTIAGKPIQPSASNFTVAVQADCYANGSISRPVPTGYPSNTAETFDFNLTKVPSGYLDVTLRSTATGNPVIPAGQVQVSGGQANIAPRVRDTDSAGKVRFCLDPSGSVSYVVSAAKAGFGAGSILATVNANQTTPLTMYLAPTSGTGTIRLTTATSGKLVRLQAVTGTYDAQQTTNTSLYADFTGLASGSYVAYVATGFSGGTTTWSTGKSVTATANQVTSYSVP
ncbi:MAG: prepilin-type N-terminal cleavage/methylation domain-containing protein [Thermoleophilia bacterium]